MNKFMLLDWQSIRCRTAPGRGLCRAVVALRLGAAVWMGLWLAAVGHAQFITPPINDMFTNAQPIIGVSGTTSGNNTNATIEPGEPLHATNAGPHSVWYDWVAPQSGVVIFTTLGTFASTGVDTILAAYTSTNEPGSTNPVTLASLVQLASNDDFDPGNPGDSLIAFNVVVGQQYFIAMTGVEESQGNFVLRWDMPTALTNVPPPGPNEVQFGATLYQVQENTPGYVAVAVYYGGGAAGPVTVDYATADGSAVAGLDYYGVQGTLTFNPGTFVQTFVVPIIDNAVQDGDRVFFLRLSNLTGGAVWGQFTNATVQILDDETVRVPSRAGAFEFTSSLYQVTEHETFTYQTGIAGRGSYPRNGRDVRGVLITVRRTMPDGGPVVGRVMVDYYTTNSVVLTNLPPWSTNVTFMRPAVPYRDYEPTAGTLVFEDFQMSTNFVVRVFSDGMLNGNAEFQVVLANPRPYTNSLYPWLSENPAVIVPTLGAISNTTVRVLEIDSKPYFAFDRISYREDEDGGSIRVTVVYPPFGQPSSVNLRLVRPLTSLMAGSDIAVPDGDFLESACNLTIEFPQNRNWIEVEIPIYDDSLVEFNEDFVLRLDPIPGQPPVHPLARFASATIVLNDQPPGALDRDWNPDGVAFTPDQPFNRTPGANAEVRSVAVQPDGKTVLGGDFTRVNTKPRNRIARLNLDGSVDNSFQPGDGANSTVTRVLLYPDSSPYAGRILIVGSFTTYNNIPRRGIARLLPSGALDPTFMPGNGARGPAGTDATIWAAAIQPDDKIIVAGDFVTFNDVTRYGLARLNPDGSLDQTLDPAEGADGVIQAVGLDASSPPRIYIGGYFLFYRGVYRGGIARLNTDGTLDTSFDPGTGTLDPDTGAFGAVFDLAVQPDGRVLIAGNFTSIDFRSRNGVARLLPDGALDTSFDPGSGANDAVFSLTLDPAGRPLIGGPFTSYNGTRRMGLARLKPDGTLDTSFLDTAYNQFAGLFHHLSFDPPSYVNSIALQPDGKIMIGGSFTNLGGMCHSSLRGGYQGFTRDMVRNRFNIARLISSWGESGDPPTPNPPQGPGNVQFIKPDYTVDENGGFLAVELRRVDATIGPVWVTFTTSDRLAVAGQDYRSVSNQIAFGGTTYVVVPILDDLLEEGDETLDLRLSDPLGGGTLNGEYIPLGGALGLSKATLTIADNDRKPGVLTFASREFVTNENARFALITVIRTNGSSGTVGVQYYTRDGTATAPADYTAIPRLPPRTLTFAPGVTSQTFTVTIANDDLVEFDETVILILTNATGGATLPGGLPTSTDLATLTIVDDDFPAGRLNFQFSTYTAAEAQGVARITVTRTGGNSGALSVRYATRAGTATSGADYTDVTGILNWADGDSTARAFEVPLVWDGTVDDPNGVPETVNLILYDVSVPGALGSRTNAVLQILDSDAYGTLSFSQPLYMADENGTNVTITVVRQGGVADRIQVDFFTAPGTAVPGPTGDYLPTNGTLVFGPGELSKSFSVQLVDDTVTDGDKTVALRLTNAVPPSVIGARSNAVLQIVDDESFNLPAGSLDTTFSPDAQADGPVYALALQPDGRLLIAGAFEKVNQVVRRRIARLKSLGSLDPTFDVGAGPDNTIHALALQPDGRILIGGAFTNVSGTNRSGIARLNSDGSIDRFFNPGAGVDNPVFAIALQPDDKILIGGAFATVDGWMRFGVARLNTNGTVDATFDPGSGANGNVYALALQADGKILIGGEFTLVDGVPRSRLARLLPNGRLDTSFAPTVIGSVRAILVQPDGRIVVGGSFTNVNGVTRNYLARLLPDGSLDSSFLAGMAGADSAVFALAQQPDGKLLVAGDFTHFNEVTRNRLTRLNPDGSNDPTINFGEGADAFIAAVVVQPDRKIVIGGGFTRYDGIPRRSLARLYGGSMAGPGRLEYTAAEYRVFEDATNVVITIRRVGGTTGAVSVDFATTNGTALAGVDYLPTNGTVRFPQAETRQRFTVPIINNTNVLDGDRWLYVGLGNYTGGATAGPQPWARVLILNDDSLVSFSLANFSVPENPVGGNATVPVLRSGNTNSTLVVSFATGTNGTATPGLDFVPTNGTVVFMPGDTLKYFNVPILEDTLIEGNETIELLLTEVSPTNAAALGVAVATLTIVDNDFGPGEIFLAATNLTVNEFETNVTLTVIRTNGSSGIVSVSFATADVTARQGLDYLYTAGSLTFQNNETLRTINVPIIPDFLLEGNETFVVRLFNPTGGAVLGVSNVATVTILDNVLIHGSLEFSTNQFAAYETNGAVTVTVSRLFGSLGDISVGYRTYDLTASNGFDYVGVTNRLVWADGDTSPKSFVVPLLDDVLVEGDEIFGVELFDPAGGASLGGLTNAVVTILNDDVGPGFVGFAAETYTAAENAGTALITVRRIFGSTGVVSVDFAVGGGTARPYLDYVPTNGTLVFGDGVTNLSFAVVILDNGVAAEDKTLGLRLANPAGGVSTNGQIIAATLTIVENEPEAGSVDSTFSGLGANAPVEVAVVLTNSGQLLVGGQFTTYNNLPRNYLVRLNPNGSVDPAFDPGTNFNGPVVALAVTPTNYYVGGYFTNVAGSGLSFLVRLSPSGLLDTNFFSGMSGVDNYVAALALQRDGSLVVGGQFTRVNGQPRLRIARLQPDGALDPTWSPMASANDLVRALALQPDGKILVAGDFTQVNGVPRVRVARLNADGTLDLTFDPGIGPDDAVRALVLQPDGRVLIGGSFITVNNLFSLGIARLLADGGLDPDFVPGWAANDYVGALALQPNGKVWVGGGFTLFDGVGRNRLTRLHPNGAQDFSVNLGAGANNFVATIALQPDGKVVVGGGFTSFDGVPVGYLTRLNGSDNIGSGRLVFTATNYTVVEANTNVVLTVRRQLGSSNAVQVSYATFDGTATNFIHYLPTNGVLLFPPGETLATISVPILDDNETNAARFFSVALSQPLSTDPANPATLGQPQTAAVTILNNDQVLSFSAPTFFVGESATNAVITVDRYFGSAGTVSVQFQTLDGTATAPADYLGTNGTLVFADGQTQATFTVPILNDTQVEGSETVFLLLTNVTGSATTALAQATLTIVDDDFSVGQISFSQVSYVVSERGTNALITVVRSGGSAGPAAVDFTTIDGTATAGLDYRSTNGTLVFPDGVFTRTFEVPIFDDTLVEGDETVLLRLSNPVGAALGAADATLTILADEALLSFATPQFVTNEFATNAVITVIRAGGGTGTVSVDYATSNLTATAGLDYSNVVGTLVFQPGESNKTFLVPILDDRLGEGDETVLLVLTNAVGEAVLANPSNAVLTILDDDISFSFSQPTYSFLENSGAALVTVNRTGVTNTAVSVSFATSDGTALAGLDYQFVSAVLTFAPGEVAKVVSIPLIDDNLGEPVEFFYGNLNLLGQPTNLSLGTPSVTVIEIIDDEDTFSFGSISYLVDESATNAVIDIVRNGRPSTANAVTVTFSTVGGTATPGVDYLPVTNYVVVFNLGQLIQQVVVPILDDTLVEGNETVRLRLSNPTGGPRLVEPAEAELIILDNDVAISFVQPSWSAQESSGAAQITVRLSGFTTNLVAVSYQTTNGSATPFVDYQPVSGRLFFLPGQTNAVITVPLLDDLLIEGNETVGLRLFDVTNALLAAPSNAVLTILDDDASIIIPAGATLVAESGPVNQLIDPGETVTVEFGLRNVGNVDTVNLIATLLATNGVVSPSPSTNAYGVVVAGGPTVVRRFTFQAQGVEGGVVAPTFALRDIGNNNNLGLTNFLFVLGRSIRTYTNPAAIIINDLRSAADYLGRATPYPSELIVSNQVGVITKVTVTVLNLTHEYPGDIDMLLVGPSGTNVMLMSDALGNGSLYNVTLTFDDAAPGTLPNQGAVPSGTYRPVNYGPVLSDPFPAPFPSPAPLPYGTSLSVFNGTSPNGVWRLYVVDDAAGQDGNIAGGWSLTVTTTDTLGPTPDLGLGLLDTPDPVVVGALLTNIITVANHGPGTATNFAVNNLLAPGLVLVTNLVPAGVTYSNGLTTNAVVGLNPLGQPVTNQTVSWTITYRFATLPVEGVVSVTNVTRTTVEGTITNTAVLVVSQPDLYLGNNRFSGKTTVVGLPAVWISRKDDRVVIAWPVAASSFTLEGSPSLTVPQWTPVTVPPTLSDGLLTVTLEATGPMRFFRLRAP